MTEENNIFAVGCSFTWGESLQFFSGLDSVIWKKEMLGNYENYIYFNPLSFLCYK